MEFLALIIISIMVISLVGFLMILFIAFLVDKEVQKMEKSKDLGAGGYSENRRIAAIIVHNRISKYMWWYILFLIGYSLVQYYFTGDTLILKMFLDLKGGAK